ncbi:hypothetical protein TTHERM_00985010 (macronuclear) [Tetrahymena thermophila SB210]|uniref:Uncharacterized protein n=1 Tax=Tetrahymena thermophila (strain SB210) TaxID=312017 RepID=Q233X7_TETTS|nr:hypothetical protein TTHERM_00985010 [Tetrahymena thermophila SB210]7TGH_B9 Chain B9, NDUB9 [Tetrahymena thermophila]8B6F_AQ Chain AQ, NADH dehydrogenase [ubiquinone] 1 alpha subcomplex subunit 10, mitochondrial [Tetrahymena thermophila SB210]8BQS_AQ Chain AQ, NADH dehydrogenase [ubiquinone] 1 alpha subcomplex subunit 10, mitochondrial [Tetrahymena thermophila SB210]8GYM_B9 Chain B9, NADH dehydrogenase [ubiquinone] 1 alpha subcomplex subunit 10, mitochondrial [Tetrahymena thermophila SB210]|eukprot:XP_001012052.2 hypothetical protein TTHERM_00985010 [Tetrahymena thermophila SB210]
MSKAYYFVKNFSWAEVSNLLCYGTKYPTVLNHQQKVTRLYRATLRRVYAHQVEGYKTDFKQYNENITDIGKDFNKMLALKPESLELQAYFKKYEDLQEELFDPAMIIDESRPYAASSGRYYIFDDYLLKFDPFGFYSPKLLSENRPEEAMPFYEDYPQNDSHWNLWEQFPEDFEDSNAEREAILKSNKH